MTSLMILLNVVTVARADDVVPPTVYKVSPTGVNISDGTFMFQRTDLSIGTLSLQRFYTFTQAPSGYAERDADAMFYGPHTSNNFDIFVSPALVPPTKTSTSYYTTSVHIGSGSSGLYQQPSLTPTSGVYAYSADASTGILAFPNGVYNYTDQSDDVYTFNKTVLATGTPVGVSSQYTQRVSQIAYPNGMVRTFSYNSSSQLKMVSDSAGYAIIFDWSNGVIVDACGFSLAQNYVTASSTCAGAALKVTYQYTNGVLSSVTDVTGKTESYTTTTASSNVLGCIIPPGYTTCKVTNKYSGGLAQTFADGTKWTFAWTYTNNYRSSAYEPMSDYDNTASFVDPNNNTWSFVFTGNTPDSVTDPLGNKTVYHYVGAPNWGYQSPPATWGTFLSEVDYPEGNKYFAQNYGPYEMLSQQTLQPKPGSNLPNIVVNYKYNCPNGTMTPTCTKVSAKIDANGNETDYTYTAFGAVQSELQPAPTSGAARPLKLYTYVQKSPNILNSAGQLVASTASIWQPSTETACQTVSGSNNSQLSCDPNAAQVVTTYQYGASGAADDLLLHGKAVASGGVTLNTCYGYDVWSNRVSETAPRAGLSTCP